jgi:hypothetical protein
MYGRGERIKEKGIGEKESGGKRSPFSREKVFAIIVFFYWSTRC